MPHLPVTTELVCRRKMTWPPFHVWEVFYIWKWIAAFFDIVLGFLFFYLFLLVVHYIFVQSPVSLANAMKTGFSMLDGKLINHFHTLTMESVPAHSSKSCAGAVEYWVLHPKQQFRASCWSPGCTIHYSGKRTVNAMKSFRSDLSLYLEPCGHSLKDIDVC